MPERGPSVELTLNESIDDGGICVLSIVVVVFKLDGGVVEADVWPVPTAEVMLTPEDSVTETVPDLSSLVLLGDSVSVEDAGSVVERGCSVVEISALP